MYPRPCLAVLLLLALSASSATAEPDRSAAIVGGEVDAGHPAVPLIQTELHNGAIWWCSGTLVTPTVVLTAAHCVDRLNGRIVDQHVYFGTNILDPDDPGFIEEIPAIDFAYWPDWQLTIKGDIALVRLDRPAVTDPIPWNSEPLEESILGSPIRVVGWGQTHHERTDLGTKRTVVTTIHDFATTWVFNYGTINANICYGDSGGPALLEVDGQEVVAGVNSFLSTGSCLEEAGASRVAPFADWIEGWLDRWSIEPNSLGDGEACKTHLDCTSGFCPYLDGQSTCRPRCVPDGKPCDPGHECIDVTPDVGACVPAAEDGGCSSGRGPGPGVPIVLLLAAAAATLRRRRRSRLATPSS